jgi:hypothetical protein
MPRVPGKSSSFWIFTVGLVFWSISGSSSTYAADVDLFEMEADGAYTMGPGDTKTVCENLAVFEAKRAATEAAEKYFSRRERISPFGKKRDEIINITADRVDFIVVQERRASSDSSGTCRVRLKISLQPSDFIEGEIESLRMEKAEADESLRKKMEPTISSRSLPGHDIARAYRYVRKGELRLAIIYLDRLQLKYPNWPDTYEVKALAYDLYNEPAKMKEALQKACALGSQTGCVELKMLTPQD